MVLLCLLFSLSYSSGLAQETTYKIQPTDVLKITVHEQADLDTKTRVTSDGYITFPLLGKIQAKGFTVLDLEIKIKELLEKDYLVNAQVLVFIEQYHPSQVSVMGEVKTPGKYSMPEEKNITVLEAIAMAGGFSNDADINGTLIMRVTSGERETIKIRVKDITEKGQKEKDIVLEADDIVYIPESLF